MTESHESYLGLAARLRSDRTAWPEVAYRESRDGEGRWQDPNYLPRLGALRCLQFDRRPEDESLLRYIFTEEIAARRADTFQGESWVLDLSAFLLVAFRRATDIGLFWQAKCANFDTHHGFDREYLFFLASQTDDVRGVIESDARLTAEDRGFLWDALNPESPPTQERLAQWWAHKHSFYPLSPDEESIWRRLEIAQVFGDLMAARHWLEVIQADPVRQAVNGHWHRCTYEWASMEQFAEAYQASLKNLDAVVASGETEWEIISARQQVAEYATKVGRLEEAFSLLEWCAERCVGEAYREYGIARGCAEALFDLALVAADTHAPGDLARRAFVAGTRLFSGGVRFSLFELQKGETAARAVGDMQTAERYVELANQEEERIEEELSGEDDDTDEDEEGEDSSE